MWFRIVNHATGAEKGCMAVYLAETAVNALQTAMENRWAHYRMLRGAVLHSPILTYPCADTVAVIVGR